MRGDTKAILVLIPKEKHTSSMHGFRPLSLCNVPLKPVSKIIVSRMKGILKSLIFPCQTIIVPGRQGLDYIILC